MKRIERPDPAAMRRVSIQIEGNVQGIGFRWSARHEAQGLGVGGFVRNEVDGSVHAEAEGSPAAIQAFIAWCWQGPQGAAVSNVTIKELAPAGDKEFGIRVD